MKPDPVSKRPFDAVLAVGIGGAVSCILLLVTSGPIDLELTEVFQTASWPQAVGQNIVNVILVDFRALDTFGEVAVVLVAAISVYALLKAPKRTEKE